MGLPGEPRAGGGGGEVRQGEWETNKGGLTNKVLHIGA